jgi:hypothetical protein
LVNFALLERLRKQDSILLKSLTIKSRDKKTTLFSLPALPLRQGRL